MRFGFVVAWLVAVAVTIVPASGCRSKQTDDGKLERITLAPREVRRSVGQAQHLTATGHYAGGTTRNLTQHLAYASSDPAVARASNAKGARSRIEAVAPGSATITATDPTTGVSSRTTGDDVTMTVLGALESITLTPGNAKRRVGQAQRLTATGHYAGGTTRNLTQHVTYRSSDAAVATVPNGDGDRSRVEAIGAGTATITAVDPATGIASSTATIEVVASADEDRRDR